MESTKIRIEWAKERIEALWASRNFTRTGSDWRRKHIKAEVRLIRNLRKMQQLAAENTAIYKAAARGISLGPRDS